jgi:small-conductance mechanosensitive channel
MLFEQFFQKAYQWFTAPLFRIGGTSISISSIIQLLIILLIVFFVSLKLKRFLKDQLLKRLGISQGNRETISTILSYSLGILGLILVLDITGFNLASLAVLAGGLGIGIGFGLQEITKDFVSGVTLLIERKIKVGDFIELDSLSGYVTEISLRSTVIRTITQKYIVVPNNYLLENHVINLTYHHNKGWVGIPVRVAHESDTVLVIEILLDSAYMEKTVSYEYPAQVIFTGFGDTSLNFTLWVWINQIDKKHLTESSLNFIIEYNLRQHGIKLATPKLELLQRHSEVSLPPTPPSNSQNLLQLPQQTLADKPSKPLAIKDLLLQVPYFKNCTNIELRKLIEIGYRQRLGPSEILYREGDPGSTFYIILIGSVEYFVEKLNQPPTILRAGEFVGELSLMLGIRRTVTVKTREETILFAIPKGGFEKLLQDQPKLYETIVQQLGQQKEELSQQQRQLQDLGLLDVEEYDKNPVDWVRHHLEKLFAHRDE